jgi:putative chitinase
MTFDWKLALLKVAPGANRKLVESLAIGFEKEFGPGKSLNNRHRCAHLIGQMAVETQGFTKLDENLNYRAERLTQVWPRRFPTLASAMPFAMNPQALGNKTYNGRMGNRPDSDDGYFFRGCGGLHHTGRSEHKIRAAAIGVSIVDFGRLMRDPTQGELILRAAISYCDDRSVWNAMDRNNIQDVTLTINGGQNGLDDRRVFTKRAYDALKTLSV